MVDAGIEGDAHGGGGTGADLGPHLGAGRFGDANLDGAFDSGDLVQIFATGEYEDDQSGNSTWADGDWNCDGIATPALVDSVGQVFLFDGWPERVRTMQQNWIGRSDGTEVDFKLVPRADGRPCRSS